MKIGRWVSAVDVPYILAKKTNDCEVWIGVDDMSDTPVSLAGVTDILATAIWQSLSDNYCDDSPD